MPIRSSQPVHLSIGAYGRLPHQVAIAHALHYPPSDPVLGVLSTAKMQLCPQNRSRVDVEMAVALRRNHPDIEWRLHANVWLADRPRIVDLCDWPNEPDWFAQVGQLSGFLKAPTYTAHAGQRGKATVDQVLRYALEAEQCFGLPVGIEGHYPTPRQPDFWLFSSWEEYRLLLGSGVHYALDLSHLHILATCSGRIEWSLVQELLANDKCLEVHVSGNDGSADQHLPLEADDLPWWFPLLDAVHETAVIFSEGKQSPAYPLLIS